ncbi:MAG: hypothetical protein H6699_01220, partial [Myxococcales bacterium]|nr:hypothetical protein [Myxococcales bacterium]
MSEQEQRILAAFAASPSDSAAFEAAVAALVSGRAWNDAVDVFESRAEATAASEALWRRCVETLEAILNATSDASERGRILLEIGAVWEGRLDRADQALLAYQGAFRVDRSLSAAYDSARALQASLGGWSMVARITQLELQTELSAERRVELLRAAARVHRDHLEDDAAAERLLAEARALAPDDADGGGSAPAGADDAPRGAASVERLEARLYGTRGEARAALLLEIAEVMLESGGRADEAEPYVAEARQLAATHPQLSFVEALLARSRGDAAGEIEAIERFAATRADDVARGRALARVAEVHAAAGRGRAADESIRRALELAPRDQVVRTLASARCTTPADWATLAETLEGALTGAGRAAQLTDTHAALGEIYWNELDDLEAAERHYKRVRLSHGRDPAMLRFYVEYHRRRGEWERAISAMQALRGAGEAGPALEHFAELARIAEHELHDVDRAIDIWTTARTELPSERRPVSELRGLLRRGERWNRLVELLKAELAALPEGAEERVALLLELAGLYRDRFNLPVLVGNTYNAVLAIEPHNAEACDALADRYERAARWNDLADVLARRATGAAGADAAGRWRAVAQVRVERLGDPTGAAAAYEAALAADPEDEESVAELARLYADRPEQLFPLRRHELRRHTGQARRDGLRELLALARDAGRPVDDELEILRELASEADDDAVSADLEATLARAGAWAELVEVVSARVDASPRPSGADAAALARLLAEHQPDPEREASLWRVALADGGGEAAAHALHGALVRAAAWDELEVFAGERGSWSYLVEPLEAAIAVAPSAAMLRRLARVRGERLADDVGRVAALESALSHAPEDRVTLRELENAYALVGNAEGRARALEGLLASAPDARSRREARLALANVLDDELNRPAGAFECLEAAALDEVSDVELLDRTTAVAIRAGLGGRWYASLKRQAATLPAGDSRLGVFRVIVGLALGVASAPHEAAGYLERIRDERPDTATTAELLRLYQRLDAWDRVIMLASEELPKAVGDIRTDLGFAMARALVEQAAASADPTADLAAALDGVEVEVPRLRELRTAFARTGRWRAVAAVAERERNAARGPADRRAATVARAEALLHEDTDAAIEEAAVVCREWPDSDEAGQAVALFGPLLEREPTLALAMALEPALRHGGRWDLLAVALDVRAGDDPRLVAELAELRARRLGDPAGAFEALTRVPAALAVAGHAFVEEIAVASGRQADAVGLLVAGSPDIATLCAAARLSESFDEARARDLWQRAYD